MTVFETLAFVPGTRAARGMRFTCDAARVGSHQSRLNFEPTRLTFEPDGGIMDVTIGALDDPALAQPVIQLARASRITWVDDLPNLPAESQTLEAIEHAKIVSYQHPDFDTAAWPRSDT